MNAMQLLVQRIRDRFPVAKLSLDPASNATGSWFLDVELHGLRATVEWRANQGFGISSCPGNYGEGPEEVVADQDTALDRVFRLLAPAAMRLLVLRTPRLDQLREFYRTLGMSFVLEQHGTGPVHYAGKTGTLTLELYPSSPDILAGEPLSRLGFAVYDLQAVIGALQRAGVAVLKSPRETAWGLCAEVCDPDGRVVELAQS